MFRNRITVQLMCCLNRCVAVVCRKSARHWLTAAPSNSTQITDKCGVGHDSCCVSDAITHYDRPNISSASDRHGAKRHGDVFILICVYTFFFCDINSDMKVPVVTIEFPFTSWRNSSATRSQCASYRSVRSQSSSTS